MKVLLRSLPMLAAAHLAAAEPVSAVRWHSADGRTFEGVFLGSGAHDRQALFLGPAGGRLAVDTSKLTKVDRRRIEEWERSGMAARAAAASAPFRPSPAPDRTRVPVLNQEEFGSLVHDCVPNALASFLLWWDQTGILAVPRAGDPRTKAAWLHETLAQLCATSETSGTSTQDAHRGLREYFQRHHTGTAAVRVGTDYDCSPANLARYTTGPAACLLETSVFYGDVRQGSHVVALLTAKPDGTLSFRTWGLTFEGRLRALDQGRDSLRRGRGEVPATRHAVDILNGPRLPEWFHRLRIRLIIDPGEWNGVTVAVPYLYQKVPGTAPPPPDPLFVTLAES